MIDKWYLIMGNELSLEFLFLDTPDRASGADGRRPDDVRVDLIPVDGSDRGAIIALLLANHFAPLCDRIAPDLPELQEVTSRGEDFPVLIRAPHDVSRGIRHRELIPLHNVPAVDVILIHVIVIVIVTRAKVVDGFLVHVIVIVLHSIAGSACGLLGGVCAFYLEDLYAVGGALAEASDGNLHDVFPERPPHGVDLPL